MSIQILSSTLQIEANAITTLALAAFLSPLGATVKSHIRILNHYCTPAPVVGGFLFMFLTFLGYVTGSFQVSFDTYFQSPFMPAFFTTVGLSASFLPLKRGGVILVVYWPISGVISVIQNAIGIAVGTVIGLPAPYAPLSSATSMIDGHGATASYRAQFTEMGYDQAMLVSAAAATFGLVTVVMIGGPLGSQLIVRYKLTPDKADSFQGSDVFEVNKSSGEARSARVIMENITVLLVCMAVGAKAPALIGAATGMSSPTYVGAMFAAVLVRNLNEKLRFLSFGYTLIGDTGEVMLSFYLSMVFMSLKFWELAGLIGGVLLVVCCQVIFMIFAAYFTVLHPLGSNYDAAVMCARLCGHGLGAIPSAIVNMTIVTEKYGMPHRAFMIMPIVGASLVDTIYWPQTIAFICFSVHNVAAEQTGPAGRDERRTHMKTDTEIAQEAQAARIEDIARAESTDEKYLEQYGRDKAKVSYQLSKDTKGKSDGKLVLVTAITPTPTSEGKTTTSVGLADGLKCLGKSVAVTLREPSFGPVFGVKDGTAGGGYMQVVPMEEINLHFTDDLHAIGVANNLLAALIDNHTFQDNTLRIDDKCITWKRAANMDDRRFRSIIDGLGKRTDGRVREDGFEITVASEIVAVFCLAEDLEDLKERLARMIIDYNMDNESATAGDLHAEGVLTALLKDALKPNLVQTLEHTPAPTYGRPLANIAHGCNSMLATRLAFRLNDYAITETGFGASPGVEKFIGIKCRMTGLRPDCAVVVATMRALKHHGGVDRVELNMPNVEALKKGLPNLLRHVENMTKVFGLSAVVAINRFPSDSEEELNCIADECKKLDVNVVLSEVWAKGGEGSEALARGVMCLCEDKAGNHFCLAHEDSDNLEEKFNKIVREMHRGDGVVFMAEAEKQAKRLEELDFGHYPVRMTKTQFSLPDNKNLTGAPRGSKITAREVRVSTGAGFIVVKTGDIMTMPGFPKVPATEHIDIDENGKVTGLF